MYGNSNKFNLGWEWQERAAILFFILVFGFILAAVAGSPVLGLYPFGPERTITATVNRLYVDVSGSKESADSHYMVGTDVGVFEVDNSWWLHIWDADKKYAMLKEGNTYELTIKGNERTSMFFQSYPGITKVVKKE